MTREYEIVAGLHRGGQLEAHYHDARFKVLACGRRWGKTRLGVFECIDIAMKGKRAWWVAPSYKMGNVGWRPLMSLGARMGAEVRRVDRQILLPNGGEVTVRSADDPQSLRGEGLDFVVLDECAYMSEAAWHEALRPALSDRQGGAMFISTPKGRNWFWRRFQEQGDTWQSWSFPTSANPHIDPLEIEAARESLPENIFRQEYLAEFLENEGAVFRNVYEAATLEAGVPHEHKGHRIVFGSDWGKQNDFTVNVGVCSKCREMLFIDRFNKIDYIFQRQRLHYEYQRWKPSMIMPERNSMGEPVIEQLYYGETINGIAYPGLPIGTGPDGKLGFFTSATSKPPLIEDLQLAIEKGELKLLDNPILLGELLAYERSVSGSGRPKYSAPEGMHDDTVMALALAWNAVVAGGLDLG